MSCLLDQLMTQNRVKNHFVVISLTDKSEATPVEKKVDMKDAPLVGKLGSTEKSKSLKD